MLDAARANPVSAPSGPPLRAGSFAAFFDRTRLRVNDASKVEASVVFFERAADAPPAAVSTEQAAVMRSRPIRELGAQEDYAAILDRDTLEGYSDFIAAYPDDPMAKRVRAVIAARREALTWQQTSAVDKPPAYWPYLRLYPQGPHTEWTASLQVNVTTAVPRALEDRIAALVPNSWPETIADLDTPLGAAAGRQPRPTYGPHCAAPTVVREAAAR